MANYIAKRLVALIVILFFISLGTFFLVHILPGDPTVTILGPNDNAQNRAILLHQLGLNQPLWDQYLIWIGHVLSGNLGQSYVTHQTVASVIANAFPIDLELIIISQLIAFPIAIVLALFAARRPNKTFDKVATTTTFAGLALPPFIVAPLMVIVFSIHFHVFPGPASYVPISQNFWTNIDSMLLPSIVLAIGSIVIYYRLLRNDLIATLQEEFITMARSKGMSDRRVLLKHAFRPSSISLLASAGINIAALHHRGLRGGVPAAAAGPGLRAGQRHQPARLPGGPGHRAGGGGRRRGDQLHRRLLLLRRRPADRP